MNKKCSDHLGKEFDNSKDMARYWNVDYEVFWCRLHKLHWTLEMALTVPVRHKHRIIFRDPETGKECVGVSAMSRKTGITANALAYRVRNGKDLFSPVNQSKCPARDHHGAEYESLSAMCKFWKVPYNVFQQRIASGKSIEECLAPVKPHRKRCKDHLGHAFCSLKKMCDHWGISPDTFRYRIKNLGLSLEEALTTKEKVVLTSVSDHKGNVFQSLLQLARFHKISINALWYRLNVKKWPMDKALSVPVGSRGKRYAKNAG